nr:hypothetical protein [Tanacetum cinerariifolium]
EELEKLKHQEKEANDAVRKEATHETRDANTNSTNLLNADSVPVNVVGPSRALNDVEPSYPDDPLMPHLEDIFSSPSEGIFTNSSYDEEGVVTDFNNLETTVNVSPTPTTRIPTIHPKTQILRDPMSVVQTRSKVHKNSEARAFVSYIQKQQRNNHNDFQHCLFACFLSQIEPKKISQALEDKSWVDAMQEELLQFKIQKVWILVDLPFGKKAIGTKWVYKNKKDERGVSAFLYGTIDEELYVTQPPRFVDPEFPNKVYKVVKALYGLHQAPRAWYATLSTFLERSRYRRGDIVKTLFIKQDKKDIMLVQKEDGIFISQDKYVAEILKKFDFLSVRTASTPIETQKPLVNDEFQVTPKTLHLQAMKRIFRYLKGQLKLGLWYPKVSSFNLEAYSDSDYTGANLDRKSTTGGCQFLGRRLISWQCKKQTIMATSIIEAEHVAAAHCSALLKERLLEVTTAKQSALVLKPPPGMNLAALWHQQSSVLPQTRSLTSQVDRQLRDMSHQQDIYENPSLTKKVFANMKRVGAGFFEVITPLFETMLVPATTVYHEEEGHVLEVFIAVLAVLIIRASQSRQHGKSELVTFCPGLRFVLDCVLPQKNCVLYQWHSRLLRYIDTRPNGEALRKCILSGPYKPTTVLVQAVDATDDSSAIPEHTTLKKCGKLSKGYNKNGQANQDPYYQTSKPHKSYAPSSKPLIPNRSHTTTRHKGKEIAKPITPPSETASEEYNNPEQAQRDKDIQKNLALIAKYFKKIYKPTNNNLRTSSNLRNKNVDMTPQYKNDNQSGQFGNQRTVNVAGARENIGSPVVQQSGIQRFNCKEFGHFVKECRKPKRVKNSAYHKEKILLYKQTEQGVPLQAEQYDWLADTDEEIDE